MNETKLARAAALRAEADALVKQAFDERPMPKRWKVGQKVRMITDREFAWNKGNVGTIIELRDKGKLAKEYQVFFTSFGAPGKFWTTPQDVELVEDASG